MYNHEMIENDKKIYKIHISKNLICRQNSYFQNRISPKFLFWKSQILQHSFMRPSFQ